MFVFENSDGVILSVAMTQGKMRECFFYNLVMLLRNDAWNKLL